MLMFALYLGINLVVSAPCWLALRKRRHWSLTDYLLPLLPLTAWFLCVALSIAKILPNPSKTFVNAMVEPVFLMGAHVLFTLIRTLVRGQIREAAASKWILVTAILLAVGMWFLFPNMGSPSIG